MFVIVTKGREAGRRCDVRARRRGLDLTMTLRARTSAETKKIRDKMRFGFTLARIYR
jgi:hypothetical protein